jgi:DNA-binding response OmpR family regulator
LGQFQLFTHHQLLTIGQKQISLSQKETVALTLFATNIHQVVEREKLMKEIWEDQGLVVISRNVDVLVSKLRKKLMDDPSIKIINIPGKGYKCTIDNGQRV